MAKQLVVTLKIYGKNSFSNGGTGNKGARF